MVMKVEGPKDKVWNLLYSFNRKDIDNQYVITMKQFIVIICVKIIKWIKNKDLKFESKNGRHELSLRDDVFCSFCQG